MNGDEFGKDLGLMHELIVTGRKVGFERNDWKGLAHNERQLRDTLDFVRGRKWESYPVLAEVSDEDRLIWLSKAITELHNYLGFCINCGYYEHRSMWVWPELKPRLQKLQLSFPDYMDEAVKGNAGKGHCYQAHEAIKPICEQLLKVENCFFAGHMGDNGLMGMDSQGSRKDLRFPPCLYASGTSLTQAPALQRLADLCKANGKPIHIAIRYS